MATTAGSGRRVRFRGTHCIEFDAAQAPVVRLCGAGRQLRARALADTQLECAARGLPPTADTSAALLAEYARELQAALQSRGFIGDSTAERPPAAAEDVVALERQLQLAELLQAQATLASEAEAEPTASASEELASPETALPQLQLAMKEIVGHTDEGYVFGRRFVSVETFINAFEFEELAEMAHARGLAVPDLSDAERRQVTAVERELCARHAGSGAGKPLKQLTLRELLVEARARDLVVTSRASRDRDGKRSKKGLIEKLRPVLRQEVVDDKIRDKRDDLLRALLLEVLEAEAKRHQTHALLELVQRHLARLGAPLADELNAENEPNNCCADRRNVEETAKEAGEDNADVQLQRCYRQLLERLESARQLQPHAGSAAQARRHM